MGFWDLLAGGGVKGALQGAGAFAKDIRTAISGKDPLTAEQRTQLEMQAQALEAVVLQADVAAQQGQIETNKIEAASDNFFKSGWRPAVGWCCVSGLFYQFVLKNILGWIILCFNQNVPPMPSLELDTLLTLLFGMLGLGGYRTFEKIKGIGNRPMF